MDGNSNDKWFKIFDKETTPKRTWKESGKVLVAKLLMGASTNNEIDEKGRLRYTLKRPMASHIDLVYLDKSLQVLRASSGTVYVHVRLANNGHTSHVDESNLALQDPLLDNSESSSEEYESDDESDRESCDAVNFDADSSELTIESTASMAFQRPGILFNNILASRREADDSLAAVAHDIVDDDDDDDASVGTIESTASMAHSMANNAVRMFGTLFSSGRRDTYDDDDEDDDDNSAAAVHLDDITVNTIQSTSSMALVSGFGKKLGVMMRSRQMDSLDAFLSNASSAWDRAMGSSSSENAVRLGDSSVCASTGCYGRRVMDESSSADPVRLRDASEYTLQSTASMAMGDASEYTLQSTASTAIGESNSDCAVRLGDVSAPENTLQSTSSMAFACNGQYVISGSSFVGTVRLGNASQLSKESVSLSYKGKQVMSESSSAGAVRLGDASEHTLLSTASMVGCGQSHGVELVDTKNLCFPGSETPSTETSLIAGRAN